MTNPPIFSFEEVGGFFYFVRKSCGNDAETARKHCGFKYLLCATVTVDQGKTLAKI